MPKVSIGLPVYNGENYLRLSLESILLQTYEDFELVISDNASTDSTGEICREFAARDPRIRYFRQEQNLGLARNFNLTFQLARGEYFKWVSHDDLHAAEFVEACVKVLDSDREIVAVTPRGVLIDADGNEIHIVERNGAHYWDRGASGLSPIRPYDPPRRLDSPKVYERFHDVLLHTSWCLEIYALMRSDALRRTSLHRPYWGQDKRIIAELALMGRLAEIPRVMLYYRQHPPQQERYASTDRLKRTYISGGAGRSPILPRINNLAGYASAVAHHDLKVTDRLRCALALCAWLLRPKKWPTLAREAVDNLAAARQPGRAQNGA